MNQLRSYVHSLLTVFKDIKWFQKPDTSLVVLLGLFYQSTTDEAFIHDFQSRLWLTYRTGIALDSFVSDAGWGCMIRSGQMLLANALLLAQYGRDWRIGDTDISALIDLFRDSPQAPFSIHKITKRGLVYDKQLGTWYGPNTISCVLRDVLKESPIPLEAYVAHDSVIYEEEMNDTSTILFVPVRLGIESTNRIYVPLLLQCFLSEHCVGIAGGRPNSSLYFIGFQGETLLYLDPHILQDKDDETYHCASIRAMPIEQLDPSMVIGFLIKNKQDFDRFKEANTQLMSGATPLFTLQAHKPSYEDLSDSFSISSQDPELVLF